MVPGRVAERCLRERPDAAIRQEQSDPQEVFIMAGTAEWWWLIGLFLLLGMPAAFGVTALVK